MFFPTSEGFYDFRKKQYIYQYKDQIGNVRLSYWVHPDEQVLKILDRNDYYPFGMNTIQESEYSVTTSPLNYKFGGKELQESGMYDFGARIYMPDVGRWFNVDPLAELRPDFTPFRYAFNNPVNVTDTSGMSEDGGGDWDDENDNYETNSKFDFKASWTSDSHWDPNANFLGRTADTFWNIVHGDFSIDSFQFSLGNGGDAGHGGDSMADMESEFSDGNSDGLNDTALETGCCLNPTLPGIILPRIVIPVIEGIGVRLAGLWALPLLLNGDTSATAEIDDITKKPGDNTFYLYRNMISAGTTPMLGQSATTLGIRPSDIGGKFGSQYVFPSSLSGLSTTLGVGNVIPLNIPDYTRGKGTLFRINAARLVAQGLIPAKIEGSYIRVIPGYRMTAQEFDIRIKLTAPLWTPVK